MAIGFRAAGTLAKRTSANTTPLTVTVPAGTAAGDLLLLLASTWKSTSPTAAIDIPAGWTQISASGDWQVNYRSSLFYKIAGASEGSASLTTSIASWLDAQMIGFTGTDGSTPLDVTGVWGAEIGAGTTVTVPSITTVTANAWWVFAAVDTGQIFTAGSVPSGWTQRALGTTGGVVGWVVNTVLVAAPGATTATSFTKGTTDRVIPIGIALRVAGAGAAAFVPRVVII